MNTLATFFASILALFSGLLGHTSPPTTAQQPVSNVTTISETHLQHFLKTIQIVRQQVLLQYQEQAVLI